MFIKPTIISIDHFFNGVLPEPLEQEKTIIKRIGTIAQAIIVVVGKAIVNCATLGLYGTIKDTFNMRKIRRLESDLKRQGQDLEKATAKLREVPPPTGIRPSIDPIAPRFEVPPVDSSIADSLAAALDAQTQLASEVTVLKLTNEELGGDNARLTTELRSAKEKVERQAREFQTELRRIEHEQTEMVLRFTTSSSAPTPAPAPAPRSEASVDMDALLRKVGRMAPMYKVRPKPQVGEIYNPLQHDPLSIPGAYEKKPAEPLPPEYGTHFSNRYDTEYVERYCLKSQNIYSLMETGCQYAIDKLQEWATRFPEKFQFTKSPDIWAYERAELCRMAIWRFIILDLIKGSKLNAPNCLDGYQSITLYQKVTKEMVTFRSTTQEVELVETSKAIQVANSEPERELKLQPQTATSPATLVTDIKYRNIDAWTPKDTLSGGVEPVSVKYILNRLDDKEKAILETLLFSPFIPDEHADLIEAKAFIATANERSLLVSKAYVLISNIAKSLNEKYQDHLKDWLKAASEPMPEEPEDGPMPDYTHLPLMKENEGFVVNIPPEEASVATAPSPAPVIAPDVAVDDEDALFDDPAPLPPAPPQVFIESGPAQENFSLAQSVLEPIWTAVYSGQVQLERKMTKADIRGYKSYGSEADVKLLPKAYNEVKDLLSKQYHYVHKMIKNVFADGSSAPHGCLFSALTVLLFQNHDHLKDEDVKSVKMAIVNYVASRAADPVMKDLISSGSGKTVEQYQNWLLAYDSRVERDTYSLGDLEIQLAAEAFRVKIEVFAPGSPISIDPSCERVTSTVAFGPDTSLVRLCLVNDPGTTFYALQPKIKAPTSASPELQQAYKTYQTFWTSRF